MREHGLRLMAASQSSDRDAQPKWHGTKILPHVHLEIDCHCPTEPYPTFDDLLRENAELKAAD